MKKIITVIFLFFLLVGRMFPQITRGPILGGLTDTSVGISWEGEREWSVGKVRYGRSEEYEDGEIEVKSKIYTDNKGKERKLYQTIIGGLKENTQYYYQVICGEDTCSGKFTTPPKEKGEFSFVAMGDHHSSYWGKLSTGELEKNLQCIKEKNPLFLICSGDLISGYDDSKWDPMFFDQSPITEFFKDVPLFLVAGNHESYGLESACSKTFEEFFVFPENTQFYEGKMHYSFDIGDIHFIGIGWRAEDNENNTQENWEPELKEWLEEDIEHTKKRWIIVVRHKPVYAPAYLDRWNKKYSEGDEYLEELMENGGVDFYLSGHAHYYQRTFPLKEGVRVEPQNGIVYVVMGGRTPIASWYRDHNRYITYLDGEMTSTNYGNHVLFALKCEGKVLAMEINYLSSDKEVKSADYFVKVEDFYYFAYKDSLITLAKEEDISAIKELGGLMCKEAGKVLLGLLENSTQSNVRREVALALSRIADRDLTQEELQFLNDSDVEVVRNIAKALSYGINEEDTQEVVQYLRDPNFDPKAKVFLLGALHYIEKSYAAPVILNIIENTDDINLRIRGARILRKHGIYKEIKRMVKIYKKPHPTSMENVNSITIPLGSRLWHLVGGLEGYSEYDVAKDGLTEDEREEFGNLFIEKINDQDKDGMEDDWEVKEGLDPTDSTDAWEDLDGDGLNNWQEFNNATDIRKEDTDEGGVSDRDEILQFTYPLNGEDDGVLIKVMERKRKGGVKICPKTVIKRGERLVVQAHKGVEVTIYDCIGRVVIQLNTLPFEFPTYTLPHGVYFLHLKDKGKVIGGAKIVLLK